jgi:hypothetical protein
MDFLLRVGGVFELFVVRGGGGRDGVVVRVGEVFELFVVRGGWWWP